MNLSGAEYASARFEGSASWMITDLYEDVLVG